MVDNFRVCEINQGARKLVQTPMLIKKKNKVILKQFSQARGWLERKRKEGKNQKLFPLFSHTQQKHSPSSFRAHIITTSPKDSQKNIKKEKKPC